MTLSKYRQKRHFQRTPEPRGAVSKRLGRSFTVQKHAASHLHYDFRLEIDGVLKSWAVPKGPSLDPSVKRLAVHVEDHPLEYGSFEGTIPAGEYGGGTVMLWDRGQWEPIGDAKTGYREGKLKFKLHGDKLRGRWILIQSGSSRSTDERNWLLRKEQDEEARSSANYDILEAESVSVKTGRDLDAIAANKKSRRRDQSPKVHPVPVAERVLRRSKTSPTALPTRVEVQLATLAREAPTGKQWLHEIKFDGYRMICRIQNEEVSFVTRNHHRLDGAVA